MKRLSLTLAALSMAAVAGPLKVGADLSLGMVSPTIGKNYKTTTAESGMGVALGAVADYYFMDKVGASCGLAYAYQSWSLKSNYSYSFGTSSYSSTGTSDIAQSNLEVSMGPVFRPIEKLAFGAGYRWSMPLGGSYESKTTENDDGDITTDSESGDIAWAGDKPSTDKKVVDVMSTHNIYLKAGYEVIPHLTVGLDVGIGLTGMLPKRDYTGTTVKFDGDAPRASNYVTSRYALNVRYDFL